MDEPADSQMTVSDALLVESLLNGDEAAFEVLFRRHYASVLRILTRLVGSRAEAEELAQDVFVQLYRHPLRRGDNVAGWLYRVASNLGYNSLRSEKRRARREAEIGMDGVLAAPSAAVEAEQRQQRERVRAVLARMAPRQAMLLVLRQMDFSYRELAEILAIAPGSVGTLLARAERSFRKLYEEEFDETMQASG